MIKQIMKKYRVEKNYNIGKFNRCSPGFDQTTNSSVVNFKLTHLAQKICFYNKKI